MENEIAGRLSVLGHPRRLALFRALVHRYPDQVPAGDLAVAMGLPPSTLSGHLSDLVRVGLAVRARQGTHVLYGANMAGLRDMFDYLLLDCCQGRPDVCSPLSDLALPGAARDVTRVAFICTGNSARSILSEALLNHLAPPGLRAVSAGTKPTGQVNPGALAVLAEHGVPTDGLRSKTLDELQALDAPRVDLVITVCDSAAAEECPIWPGMPLSAHWGLPDPAAATGVEETRKAFASAYDTIKRRIEALISLDIPTLNRATLQEDLDAIARM